VSALAWVSVAHAQDAGAEGGTEAGTDAGPPTMTPGSILAYYCGDADMQCMMAPLDFEYTHDLAPWLPDWDTGWVPQNFKELQVRFVLKIPTDTQIKMSGKFRATWPSPLTIATPGDRFSGFLKIDYGLIVQALGKIDISVLGYDVKWQGPLPYVPQVDFHLLGMQQFDSWAYKPDDVTASAFTATVRLFKINILSLAGIPEEVAEGGVELDIRGELQATYHTEKMVIDPSVVPITTNNGETLHNFVGGPYVEIDVHPEGQIKYAGIIHLIPAFYVEVLGKNFKIPFYDYPLNITELLDIDLARQVVFDKVRIHVPLPDIPPFEQPAIVDFGKVEVGSGEKLSIAIPNEGEAKARAVGEVETSMVNVFKMLTASAMIEPGQSEELAIRFTPKKVGKFEADLIIRSNDPDLPEQKVLLRGEAVDPDDPELVGKDAGKEAGESEDGPGSTYDGGEDGGCGCRSVGSSHAAGHWVGLLGLAALGLARRRNRTVSTSKRV
jgi:MYXO-CTERM domain-containing protein